MIFSFWQKIFFKLNDSSFGMATYDAAKQVQIHVLEMEDIVAMEVFQRRRSIKIRLKNE